jgi:hypothetical protein
MHGAKKKYPWDSVSYAGPIRFAPDPVPDSGATNSSMAFTGSIQAAALALE